MALRCVYTDLDGTLLGAGASFLRDGRGEFTLLPARALEACHRAGVEVVLVSGRRRAQVMEDARLLGQTAYAFEVGSGLVVDGEEHSLCGAYAPRDGRSAHELIADSGGPALLERRFAGRLEHHSPWHRGREVSHLYRGRVTAEEANSALAYEGHDDLKLIDNGEIEGGVRVFHLIPREASKAAAVALHMQIRGYAEEECVAVGDSLEDLGMAGPVGRFFMVANGPECSGANVERTEQSHGEGFYEAVVGALMDAAHGR